MEELRRQLIEHIARDDKTLGELFYDIRLIKENHLAHIERSIGSLDINFREYGNSLHQLHEKLDKNNTETVKNTENIIWLKWGFMGFGGAVIAATVAMIFK